MVDIKERKSTMRRYEWSYGLGKAGEKMEDRKIQGFLHLERNLVAMIYEGMVKIGYHKGERQSIYYDYDLLCYLLDIEEQVVAEHVDILPRLMEFCEFISAHLGKVKVTMEKGRYKITVPEEGVDTIFEENKENTFLVELIATLRKKDCDIEEIKNVFYTYSDEVVCEPSEHAEFDYVVYFKDTTIDEFKYCFTFDVMGRYYHRLTEYDFTHLEE